MTGIKPAHTHKGNIIKNINSYSLYIGENDLGNKNLPKLDPPKSAGVSLESPEVISSLPESHFFSEGKRNDSVFHLAFKLRKSRTDEAVIRDTIRGIAIYCGLPEAEAYRTMESAIARADSGRPEKRNIRDELRKWISESPGVSFRVSDFYNESAGVTSEEKHASIVSLSKFCEEGIIEKVGKRRGEYRVVDKTIEYVDFKNANYDEKLDLILPLDIHKKTVFFPGNVIVIAGVQGYGKTTFCFNVIKDNMDHFHFVYFSSEMAPQSLKYKLSWYGIPIENWKVDVVPDNVWDFHNIVDKIHPDSINVIDYLEADAEKTFNIHGVITGCLKKLRKGMLIIAIQKNKDKEYGHGGSYTAQAASLYLSLDWNTILISKNRYMEMDQWKSHKRRNFVMTPTQGYQATTEWFNPLDPEVKEPKKPKKDFYEVE